MTTAVLSLGSNLGQPRDYLANALRELRPVLQAVSSSYRTPPWGPVEQDDFLNLIAIVSDADLDAYGWLTRAQGLEQSANRERLVHWGPRTLDVDVVAAWKADTTGAGSPASVGDNIPVISDDSALTLPHPRAAERGFVLVPWAEVQPEAHLPGYGYIADLLARLDLSGIERVGPVDG